MVPVEQMTSDYILTGPNYLIFLLAYNFNIKMEKLQNHNKLPSFRFNIADINLSTIPDQQPSLFSRNQIQRQLQLTDLSTINHNDSDISDPRNRSKSPHSIDRKRPPITNLSNFLKLNPKTRLQLQPPPNDYATFKRDHLKVDLELQQRQSQISIQSKAKPNLKVHIERAADSLLEELMEKISKERQTPKTPKTIKSRQVTPKKGKQNFSKLFEKSREQLELQMKIRQLDKALKKTKKQK